MKMLPIKYQQRYCNGNGYEDGVQEGFEPFTDNNDTRVLERIIEIEPSNWALGSCLVIRIIDKTSKGMIKILEKWIYSRDPQATEEDIVPTHEQALLIDALESQELRGDYAIKIVNKLYIELAVLEPKFGLDKYLPEVVRFYQKIRSITK